MRAEDLTIVIPTRERWPILARTLQALRGQTAQGFETVVVCDGADQRPPGALAGARTVVQEDRSGPGAARNLGAARSRRPLLLFLGDDMIPEPGLVAAHLDRHARAAAPETAVLGRVAWHPEAGRSPLMRWLDWSDAQFDYRQLDRERAGGVPEAGFGRFYSCNVSLTRELFTRAGGFDPRFAFDYEDLDLGWRLDQAGMRLLYEPAALALHLHAHDLESVRGRYESRARAERMMAAKHAWFAPWFEARLRSYDRQPQVTRLWPALAAIIPERPARLRGLVERRADRWYHQRLAPRFLAAWEGDRDLEELRAYLGDRYEHERLVHHRERLDAEAAAIGDEARLYRSSQQYLYDLTAFAMSGAKDPYRRLIRDLAAPGARLLDYGCGIGSDGLRLLEEGYRVAFADFANPSTRYLRWRLERRGLTAPVHDLDDHVPGGFDLVYAFDVVEHAEDPFALLAELEARGRAVVVNLLAGPGDTVLDRPLPIGALLRHAERRGLLRHRIHHGRSHLIAYRGNSSRPGPATSRARSRAERRLGPLAGAARRVLTGD